MLTFVVNLPPVVFEVDRREGAPVPLSIAPEKLSDSSSGCKAAIDSVAHASESFSMAIEKVMGGSESLSIAIASFTIAWTPLSIFDAASEVVLSRSSSSAKSRAMGSGT